MISDLRYAFRQLVKAPSFSLTAIVALALGIGATTAMFAVIYAFLLRPLPYAKPDQLVMLQSRGVTTGNDLGVNYLDFVDWQKQSHSFSDLAFFNLRWNGNVESPGGMTETLKTTFTTASGTAWDTLNAQTEKDLATLKSALDAFGKSLK